MTFVLAYVGPRTLDAWHCALVNSLDIRMSKVKQHFAIKLSAINLLRFDSIYYFASKSLDLFNELGSQLV
jgi:hypothetical protein